MPSLRERCLEVSMVDLRSLALLHVGLGIWVIADLIDRSRNLTLLFTDALAYPAKLMFGIKGWSCEDPSAAPASR